MATSLRIWLAVGLLSLGVHTHGPVAAAEAPRPAEPQVQVLWPNGAPGAQGDTDADRPTLTTWPAPADRATGAAMVICPGGGYGGLAIDHEGKQIAEWFNALGVTASIVKYRLGPRYRHPAPLQDAQRAVRTVRSRAAELQIDPQRIGIIGFSAGGHLASSVITHFDAGQADAEDPVERQSCRPDFAILCYPVITMDLQHTHKGSRQNLLGPMPDADLVQLMSSESQVTAQTPPTFLFHTTADTVVLPENSILFYQALRAHKIPVELHIYETGRHGVGLAQNDPILRSWPARCEDWLRLRGVLDKK